jgi:hypothetical protein
MGSSYKLVSLQTSGGVQTVGIENWHTELGIRSWELGTGNCKPKASKPKNQPLSQFGVLRSWFKCPKLNLIPQKL